MGVKSRELFGLGFWMDSSKIDQYRDILAGKQEVPQERMRILQSLNADSLTADKR